MSSHSDGDYLGVSETGKGIRVEIAIKCIQIFLNHELMQANVFVISFLMLNRYKLASGLHPS